MREEVEGIFSFHLSRASNKAIYVDVFYGTQGATSLFGGMQRIGDLVFTEESWARFSAVLQTGADSLVHEIGDLRIIPARIRLTGEFNPLKETPSFQEFPERRPDEDSESR